MGEDSRTFAEDGFEAPDPAELNALLPGYEVSMLIARGGMGAVYLAKQNSLDRNVAIKVLPREFANDPEFRSSFESEAKAMARLHHPNLIGVHDFGEVDGFLYIIMDFVDGKSLFHSARGKVIDQQEAARLVLGICEGLAHAHEAGLVHRDIKPANILLTSRKRPRIGDFGLARPADSRETTGLAFGTPDYAAPEVIANPHQAGKRADVYAVGVILYELLTGELPGKTFTPPSAKQPVDKGFDQIVRRAIHPSPNMRFADAGEMARQLETLIESLDKPRSPLVTTPDSRSRLQTETGRSGPAAGNPSNTAKAAQFAAASSDTHQRILIRNLVLIAILLVAIAAVWGAYNRRQRENDENEARAARELLLDPKQSPDQAPARTSSTPPTAPPGAKHKPDPPIPEADRQEALTLSGLKSSLARGRRDRFPSGTWELGDQRLLYVDTPMTWQAACEFAEDHGAHLATLSADSDRTAITSKFPANSAVWIGGGIVGESTWGWIDGRPWTLSDQPAKPTGPYLALTSDGLLRAIPGTTEHPFFLQWHPSGDNPGSLEAQLKRLRDSAGQSSPRFPPGTVSHAERHYLIVEKKATWEHARNFSKDAEGHLAVPDDKAEHDYLLNALTKILPPHGAAWIGGSYHDDAWHWITGEPWTFTAWLPKPPQELDVNHTALRMIAGDKGGWDNADPDNDRFTPAFVIEWSKDRFETGTSPASESPPDWRNLQRQTANTLAANRKKHEQMIRENGAAMNRDLENWYNGLDRRIRGRYFRVVQAAREKIEKDGRIEEEGRFPTLPADIGNRCNSCLANQRKLDAQYEESLERERSRYKEQLTRVLARARAERLLSDLDSIEEEIEMMGDDPESFAERFLPRRLEK